MKISATFDGGNIDCLACDDPADIRLAIRPDGQADGNELHDVVDSWQHVELRTSSIGYLVVYLSS